MRYFGSPQRLTISELLIQIQRMPSILEQLAYFASLRNPDTGIYLHPVLTEAALRRQADVELRSAHELTLRRWLNLTLADQNVDLDLYISSLSCDRQSVICTWSAIGTYSRFLTVTASQAERELFLSSFQALLNIVAHPREPDERLSGYRGAGPMWLTARNIAKRLGITDRTVRTWASQGLIPAIKVGRQWRFARRDFEIWFNSQGVDLNCAFFRK